MTPPIAESVRQAIRLRLDDAMQLGKQGEIDRALAIFDSAISRLEKEADTASRVLLASAMFNRSITLRFGRRTDEAVHSFQALIDRFQTADVPELVYWTALARYNKAFPLHDVGRHLEALAAFDEFTRAFQGSADPRIRQRLADASYQSVQLSVQLGRDDDARSRVRRILRDFGDAPEPGIQDIVAELVATRDGYVDLTAAAGHALTSQFNRAVRADLESQKVADPELAPIVDEYLHGAERLDRADAERAAELHARAVAIVTAHRQRVEPFALFLRNFDLEAHERTGRGPEGEQLIAFSESLQRVESALGAALRDRVPVVAIANPRLSRPDYQHAFPKLELPNHMWRAVLQELVAGAALIVMQVTELTPGVMTELQTILHHGRQAVTILLVSEDEPDALTAAINEVYHVSEPPHVSPSDLRAQFSAFPYVFSEHDVPFDDLHTSPAFAEALDAIAFQQSLRPEQRRVRRQIETLNREAAEDTSRAGADAAIQRLEQARALNQTVGDAALRAATESLLGVAWYQSGAHGSALAAFSEALRLARQLKRRRDEGAFLRDMANCHRAMADYPHAIACFTEALEILQEVDPEACVETCHELALAYSDNGEMDNAAECFRDVISVYEDIDFSRVMSLQMQLGTGYFHAGRYLDAIPPFEEVVRLATLLESSDERALAEQMIEKARAQVRSR